MEVVARLLTILVEWLFHPLVRRRPAASNSRTAAQAARKGLRVAAYGETAAVTTTKTTCAVCLSEVQREERVWELRNCSHVFHEACLDRWMDHDERITCPLCRAPLVTRAQAARGDELAAAPPSSSQPSWAVDRLLYLFADDLQLLS